MSRFRRFPARLIQLALLLGSASAQQAPIGIIRGDLTKLDRTGDTGELHVKTTDGQEYRCSYDRKTYFEADNQLVTPAAIKTGDRVEIVSDRKPGSNVCYARSVHSIDSTASRVGPAGRPRFRRVPSPTESFAPRGDMTFAGIVLSVNHDVLTLRTRAEGDKLILLRQDTRYIGDGQRVDADGLKRNTRVFVRAGRNLDNDIEAYQVIWGEIVRVQ